MLLSIAVCYSDVLLHTLCAAAEM